MNRVLIIFAHPTKAHSRINTAMWNAVEELDGVTINDLYATYPDFMIDVSYEQQLCTAHDVIIFQFPFYWFGAPSILKEWMDRVLTQGFAYGPNGNAMKDKRFLLALTAGADQSAYRRGGSKKYPIDELVLPYRAMSELCRMQWLPPFALLGMHRGLSEQAIKTYADHYKQIVLALRDGTLDMKKAKKVEFLSSDIKDVINRQ